MTKLSPGVARPQSALARVLERTGTSIEDFTVTKRDLANAIGVSERSVDTYVKKGYLPAPLKFGAGRSARVRWCSGDKGTLLKNLAALAAGRREAA